MAGGAVIQDRHYTTPLYLKAEAAHIIAVPAQTFRNWAVGYARKRLDGSQVVSAPIVTSLEPVRPHGLSVPFVGLTGAYIVAACTKVGLPMQRIRPAVLWPGRRPSSDWRLRSSRQVGKLLQQFFTAGASYC